MPGLAYFQGCWELERTIEHEDGSRASAMGRAVFDPTEDGLRQVESGSMTVIGADGGAVTLQFTRTYLWGEQGGQVAVRMDDASAFHHFGTADKTPKADHYCAPDTYHVAYDFSTLHEWHAVWTVRGPRKSYVMRSRFFRGAQGRLHPQG